MDDRRAKMSALVTALFLALAMKSIMAFPYGAPDSTCGEMVPIGHHGWERQSSRAPFTVVPSQQTTANGVVNIMLTSPQGIGFKGFLLKAIGTGPNAPQGAMGHFPFMADMAMGVKCGAAKSSGATHRSKDIKKSLEFTWEAPEDYEGPVVFNATFVQDYSTFWVGVESPSVQVVKRSAEDDGGAGPGSHGGPTATPGRTTRRPTTTTPTPFSPEPEQTAEAAKDPLYNDCQDRKSCFGVPEGCVSERNCDAVVAVFVSGARYEFEMKAKDAAYVAVGLSDDNKMGEDSVVECVPEGNKMGLYMSWNLPGMKKNERLENHDGVSLLESSFVDGTIHCKFSRDQVTTVKGKEYNLATGKYNLLLAAGSSLKEASVGFHDKVYTATAEKSSLAEVRNFKAASRLFVRLHGSFMLAAWIGAASIGIVLARYYKQTWVGSKICGKDLWFVWHRFFMVLVWLLTMAGFVLIFLDVGGWVGGTNIHGILGIVTTVLAFIQPIGAAFRPAPNAPRRPIFNWLHWFIGNSAHIIAIATIFFAVPQGKAQLPEWTEWILVAFVAFYAIMHIILSIAMCISERENRKRINSFPMKEMNSSRMPLGSSDRNMDAPLSSLRRFLLGIHMTVIILVTAALILLVVFAPIEESWKNLLKQLNLA